MQQVNEKGNLHGILALTAENYECPKGEEHLYHCRIEQKQFDPKNGQRMSIPRIQKFDKKMFESNLLHNLRQLGYDVDILHNPTGWLKEHAEEVKRKEQELAKAKEAAQEAAIQKRIEDAVAKALAAKAPKEKKGGKK